MSEKTKYNILDERMFEKIFSEYKSSFIRIAYRYVRDWGVAEDIVHDGFKVLWEKRNDITLTSDKTAPTYTFVTIKSKCVDYLRRKSVRLATEDKIRISQQRLIELDIATLEACNPNKLLRDELLEILEQTLSKLPIRRREIFYKNKFENKSYKAIAAEMQLPYTTVHFEMKNCLKFLRAELKDYIPLVILLFSNTLHS